MLTDGLLTIVPCEKFMLGIKLKKVWEFYNEKETFVKQKCFVTLILLRKKNPALVQLICNDVRLEFSKLPKEVK